MMGEEKGDDCNRRGCKGVITLSDLDGCCTCHTGHPPCGYCVTDTRCCTECDWTGEEGDHELDVRLDAVMCETGLAFEDAVLELHRRGDLDDIRGLEDLLDMDRFPEIRGRKLSSDFGIV